VGGIQRHGRASARAQAAEAGYKAREERQQTEEEGQVMRFSSEEIVFIHRAIKAELDKLRASWEKDFNLREKRIIQVIAETIFNLPR